MKNHLKISAQEADILRLIHARISLSRAELAKLTGLSAGLISAIIRRLITEDLVVEAGVEPTKLGRKRVALRLRPGIGYTVGIEIGTFHLRIVINDLAGNICHREDTLTLLHEGFAKVMERSFDLIRKGLTKCGISAKDLLAIGVAHSGVVDSARGYVLSFPRPGQMSEWKNVPLKEIVEKEFGAPCIVEDSVRMAAMAEKQTGAAAVLSDFVYIRIGMGIGACIFVNKEPYRGAGGSAGEFGHMTVDEHGPLCYCGNNGCLSALASCGAIIQNVVSAIRKGVQTRVLEMAGQDPEKISIEMVMQAAMDNDSLAFRVLDEAALHIGVALADVINLLNPSVVIFSGPLFQTTPNLMLDPIQRVIRQRALEKAANEVELIVSGLENDAAALGAARFSAAYAIGQLGVEEEQEPQLA